jgi:hypothetical protein
MRLYKDKNNKALRKIEKKASKEITQLENRFYKEKEESFEKGLKLISESLKKEIDEDEDEYLNQFPSTYGYSGDIKVRMVTTHFNNRVLENDWIIDSNSYVNDVIDMSNKYREDKDYLITSFKCILPNGEIISGTC